MARTAGSLILAAVMVMAACETDAGTAPDTPVDVSLLSPDDMVVTQNDPTIGCPYHPDRGYGFLLTLDWEDAAHDAGPPRYEIHVQHKGSIYPLVETTTTESRYSRVSCNSFVIDSNLEHWEWKVRALAERADPGPWSATREFRFAPCRLDDGRACSAPPPPGA